MYVNCTTYYVHVLRTTSNVPEPVCTHTHTAYYSTDYMYTGTSTVPGTLYFLKIKINTCKLRVQIIIHSIIQSIRQTSNIHFYFLNMFTIATTRVYYVLLVMYTCTCVYTHTYSTDYMNVYYIVHR